MLSGLTSQSYASTRTPAAAALRRASANAGWVSRLGVKYFTSRIWITKKTYASYPSFTARASSSRCFTARSLGASGNRHTPSHSSVTPLTSMKIFRSPASTYRSNREFPQVVSGRICVTFSKRAPPSIHSCTTRFGIWESMLIIRLPFSTAIRSHFVFRSGLALRWI